MDLSKEIDQPTEEQIKIQVKCNHRQNDGYDSLVESPDGYLYCKICKKKFRSL